MAVESSLPAYTTIENILKLIDALRRKNNDEEEAKPLFGMGDTAFRSTKSVLRTFNIIEESNTNFTATGRQIAYAGNDEERKRLFLKLSRGILLMRHYYIILLKKRNQKQKLTILLVFGENLIMVVQNGTEKMLQPYLVI